VVLWFGGGGEGGGGLGGDRGGWWVGFARRCLEDWGGRFPEVACSEGKSSEEYQEGLMKQEWLISGRQGEEFLIERGQDS